MAFRNGNRREGLILPQYIDDYVGENDSVRFFDEMFKEYSDKELGLEYDENQVGNPRYNPVAMLKLIAFAYSNGVRSSRKIEKAVNRDLSYIWLTGGLKPDHKTISKFRKENEEALHKTLRLVIQHCIRFDLVVGNKLFVDGTKLKADASLYNSWTKEKIKKHLKKIDKNIKKLLDDHEYNDMKEEGENSYVETEVKEKVEQLKKFKRKLNHIEKEIESEEDKKNHNTTDTECRTMRTKKGTNIPGYNGQIITDGEHGFIVSAEVVNENNDTNQFSTQINNGIDNIGKKCKTAVADAGYYKIKELKEVLKDGIDVIVPNREQARNENENYEENPFSKGNFEYNKEKDIYICPAGETLEYKHKHKGNRLYRIEDKSICHSCKHYGDCTKAKNGRSISRNKDEQLITRVAERYESDEGQAIYSQRKHKVEGVFGHLKHNLGYRNISLRGLDGANIELLLFSIGYNIKRMFNILEEKKVLKANS